jgi:Protein of unknown function (DUF2970)
VARAVFWSFFGIRSGKEYDKDVAAITPVQAIVAGLIGAAIFVGTLILVVRHITS